MAGNHDAQKLQHLETISVERRKLIGQAIIDGVLTAGQASLIPVAADPDYNQGQGDYTQKGGDHKQGGGGYNQSSIQDLQGSLINVIRDGSAINQ